jgi:hypothetical protein
MGDNDTKLDLGSRPLDNVIFKIVLIEFDCIKGEIEVFMET